LRYQKEIAPLHVAALGKCAQKSGQFVLRLLRGAKKSDALHLRWLLRMHRKRPRHPTVAHELDEFSPLHVPPVRTTRCANSKA